MVKPSYRKPRLKKRKVKLNFFFTQRNMDSYDLLFGSKVFAQSGGSGGSCSTNCGQICLLPETEILLPDNKTAAIMTLKVGDTILSYDLDTKQLVPVQITETYSHYRDEYMTINKSLRITPDHPVYVNGSPLPAGRVKKADLLIRATGENSVVTQIEHIQKRTVVYNIQISGNLQNYFAEDILVHSYK